LASRYVLEVSILAQSAARGGVRVSSAGRGTAGDDSKGPVASLTRNPSFATVRTGLAVTGLAGAIALIAATFSTVIEITVGTTAHIADRQTIFSGWDRHGPALLLLALVAIPMVLGAWRGSRPATVAVLVLGLVALGIALIADLPDVHDTGAIGDLYENARAQPRAGYFLETAGGVLLVLSGGGMLLLGRGARPEPRAERRRRAVAPEGEAAAPEGEAESAASA
jgi:hypothetical protein